MIIFGFTVVSCTHVDRTTSNKDIELWHFYLTNSKFARKMPIIKSCWRGILSFVCVNSCNLLSPIIHCPKHSWRESERRLVKEYEVWYAVVAEYIYCCNRNKLKSSYNKFVTSKITVKNLSRLRMPSKWKIVSCKRQ